MDYPRDNVFTYLFSTYKKTAGIAFVIILILAVPITITLVGRQQDIRQRAQSPSNDAVTPAPTNTPTAGSVSPSLTSTPTQPLLILNQKLFDFNDDGKVDEIDLNILYAGFAKRVGD